MTEEYPRGVQQCSEGGTGNEGEVRRCYRGVDRGRRWGGRSRERERDGGRNKETGMEIDEARGKRESGRCNGRRPREEERWRLVVYGSKWGVGAK